MNRNFIRTLVAAMVIVAIVVAILNRESLDPGQLAPLLEEAGIWGPVIFVALYAAMTPLMIPGSALTIMGGALFGPVWGTILNLTGATLGATLAFIVSRFVAGEWVQRRLGSGVLKRMYDGVEVEGWWFVAFIRLVPVFPFNVMNYALGLTKIGLAQYVIASFVFMAPASFAYTYLGYAGNEALAGGEGAVRHGLVAAALVAAMFVLPRLVKRAREAKLFTPAQELKRMIESGGNPYVVDVRSVAEFVEGHLPGAVNIPLPELETRIGEIKSGARVYLICGTDRRSSSARERLIKEGLDAVVTQGGVTFWKKQGWPLEK
ncbi:MAG: VTT domain-containing protein [Nitrospinae bacterium]|nr:VTT domain-containing protein [Nitrospinota bacterium]